MPLLVQNRGKSPGLAQGGHINFSLEKVPVMALAQEVPKAITLDISKLDLGQVVAIGDIRCVAFPPSPNGPVSACG